MTKKYLKQHLDQVEGEYDRDADDAGDPTIDHLGLRHCSTDTSRH